MEYNPNMKDFTEFAPHISQWPSWASYWTALKGKTEFWVNTPKFVPIVWSHQLYWASGDDMVISHDMIEEKQPMLVTRHQVVNRDGDGDVKFNGFNYIGESQDKFEEIYHDPKMWDYYEDYKNWIENAIGDSIEQGRPLTKDEFMNL